MANKVWTESAILKLKHEIYNNKVEYVEELARRLQKPERSILYILKKLGLLEKNKPTRVTRQEIVDEISSRLGITIKGLELYRLDILRDILEGIKKKK